MKVDPVGWNERFEVKNAPCISISSAMSKSSSSTQFRKVDVDQYDENNYEEEAPDDSGLVTAGLDDAEVNRLLGSNNNIEALKYVLKNAPLGSKVPAIKEKAVQVVLRVLTSFKQSEIEKAISSLGNDKDSIDLLMKYIYKGFEFPQDGSSALLLSWHDKAFAVGGSGSIMRVFTDRKRV